MIVADSSFLISLFWPDDTLHAKAAADFSNTNEILLLPDRVVEETLTVLTYRLGHAAALEVVSRIMKNTRFQLRFLNETEWREILAWMARHGKKISFADYLVAYLSAEERTLPLAYDQQLLALVKKERESEPGWGMDELLYGGNEPHSRNPVKKN